MGCGCVTTTGNYLADEEVAFFGIESSPSFVREPEGNGVAERFIRTLKENLLWVRSFATIEELRLALLAFEQWMLEKYDYRSPAQVRRASGWTRQRRSEYRMKSYILSPHRFKLPAYQQLHQRSLLRPKALFK